MADETILIPIADGAGNLFNKRAVVKKRFVDDMNDGFANARHYSDAAIGDGTTDARAALLAADAVGPIKLPPGTYAVASNLTLTKKVTFLPGARLLPASGVVVTLNLGFIAAKDQYCLDVSAAGSFVVPNGQKLCPDQFGAVKDLASTAAINACFAAGATSHINVEFLQGTYIGDMVASFPGNTRITIVGNNTWLKPATANRFALRINGPAPLGPATVSGLTFDGNTKAGHGLEIACETNIRLSDCQFYRCSLGLLINGTIDGTFDNITIQDCYAGIHMTVRNGMQHPTTISGVNSLTVATYAVGYEGQPTEHIFNRVNIKQCAVAIVVDQKGSSYARQQDLLFNKLAVHDCIIAYIQKGDETNLTHNHNQWVVVNNPWLENIGTAANVHTSNGGAYGSTITYDGDAQEHCGFANLGGYLTVRNGSAGRIYAANRSFTYLDCSEDDGNSFIAPTACVVAKNALYNQQYRPFYSDYVIPYATTNNASGTFAAAYCLPFSGTVSLEHAGASKLIYSKSQFVGDQGINNIGETFQIADGMMDRQESLGHIIRNSTGAWINSITSEQNQLYVMKMAVRAYSPAYTFTASGAVITATGHDLVDGQEVRLTTTGTLPTNLSLATSYYVVGTSGNTFGLSATIGGAAITTSGGSGTHTIKQRDGFLVYMGNIGNGSIFKGFATITDRWETYFAVGMAQSTGSQGDILITSATANLVRKIVLGPVFILKVANESEAMRVCRSQAFYAAAGQIPYLPGPKDKAESVASSATPTFDFSDSDGDTKTHTATSLVTPVITMARPGRHDLVITQDATGGREILWPTNMRFRHMAPQPDLIPAKKSLLSWVYDGTHGVADGVQHSSNYIADFDAVGADSIALPITFPDAGTIFIKCRLHAATPAVKTRLFQTKVSGPDSHYPFTDGDIYADWLRTTRIPAIAPSGSVNRTLWHWVVVRTDSTDGWDLIQSISSILYTIHSASHETIGVQNIHIGGANCQAEFDRVLIFNSRLGDVPIGNVIATTKATANSTLPSGLLARYEINNDRGGKLLQDWSGNSRDITLTDATPSLFVVNSGTN